MVLDDYLREHGFQFSDFNHWKQSKTIYRKGDYSYASPEYKERIILVYDANNSIRGIMKMDKDQFVATTRNNHAKITFQHFLTLSALNPERWVVVNKDTVALIRDDIKFRYWNGQPEIREIESRDLVYCYDVTGFGSMKNLYRFDKARFERAMTFDNIKSNEAAINYLAEISRAAVQKQIDAAKAEIDGAKEEYLKIADRLILELPKEEEKKHEVGKKG